MRNAAFFLPVLLVITGTMGLVVSCSENEPTQKSVIPLTDAYIYSKVQASGLTFYKGSSDTLAKIPNVYSHNLFMRVKFNSIANAALTNNGKLPVNAVFPDSSLIVKELYNSSGGPLLLSAVMYKAPKDSSATEGWVWNEFKPDGSVVISLSKKGAACVSCHKGSANRDLVRIFDLYE